MYLVLISLGNISRNEISISYTKSIFGLPRRPSVKNPPAKAGDAGDTGSILGSGRSPGEENSTPLHYSCLANPMDRVWWATVHGVTKT